MKNKLYLKKSIVLGAIVTLVFATSIVFFLKNGYESYKANYNAKLGAILTILQEKYPDVSKKEIVDIVISDQEYSGLLDEYGFDIENDDLIASNELYYKKNTVVGFSLVIFFGFALMAIFVYYNAIKDREIKRIVASIKNINRKNYELDLDDVTEDELSILRSEVYKTTVMLKEDAENSKSAKESLKDSLSDISHQLKTPLTSILIMLDDILDDEDMDEVTREEFLKDIKREILNINFLVQSILKLSKFDADAIVFVKKTVSIESILYDAKKNVAALADLCDVKVDISIDKDRELMLDAKWQTEALTNIIKNAIEYSSQGNCVDVRASDRGIYYQIDIVDYGECISLEDAKHIFERFYKGKNASKDSVGIGLALAKAIIEKENGTIKVSSKPEEGTKFTVRYFYR